MGRRPVLLSLLVWFSFEDFWKKLWHFRVLAANGGCFDGPGYLEKMTKKKRKLLTSSFSDLLYHPNVVFRKVLSKTNKMRGQPSPGHILLKSYNDFGFWANFDDVSPVTSLCDVTVTSQWRHTRHIWIFCNPWVTFSNSTKFYLQQIISRHFQARGPYGPPPMLNRFS